MKFLVLKKRTLLFLSCILLVCIMLSLNIVGNSSASVYFGQVPRLVPIYQVDVPDKKIAITFDSDETGKSYVVYTGNTKDQTGNIQVYASIYDPNDPNSKLEAIETEKEWKVIETILSTLQEEIQKKQGQESNE